MTRALASICCAAGFLLSLIGVTGAAWAKPKVALTQIEGDATGDIRDAVAEAIEGKELSLIGAREVNRAVDRLGDLADLTEKDFKKLATELEADAIIAGRLEKVGTAKTLKFRLFVHKKMAKGFTVSFKDAKSEKFKTMLHDKMIDKIGLSSAGEEEDEARPAKKKGAGAEEEEEAVAASGKKDKKSGKKAKAAEAEAEAEEVKPAKKRKGDDEEARPAKAAKAAEADEEEARPAKKARAAEADAEAEEARPKKKAAEEDASPAEDDAGAAQADEDEPPKKAKKKVASADDGEEIEGGVVATAEPRRGANRVAIRLDVGASVVQRSFKFNSNIRNQPKNVSISPVPGARIEAEVYPLALSSSGPLAGLGVGVEYDKTLRLNLTTNNPTTQMSYKVPVKQSNYMVGLRYRLAFGKTETSPTLTVGVGYGKRLFSTDLSKLTNDPIAIGDVRRDTPETEYTMIQPGLSFRLPVTRMVAFTIGGRGLIVPAAGPIQKGESYGRAKVYGVDAVAAVDLVLGSRFAVRLSGEFVQIGFNFLGGGQLANGLDGNLMTKEVGGLADRSIGGAATLAVMY